MKDVWQKRECFWKHRKLQVTPSTCHTFHSLWPSWRRTVQGANVGTNGRWPHKQILATTVSVVRIALLTACSRAHGTERAQSGAVRPTSWRHVHPVVRGAGTGNGERMRPLRRIVAALQNPVVLPVARSCEEHRMERSRTQTSGVPQSRYFVSREKQHPGGEKHDLSPARHLLL